MPAPRKLGTSPDYLALRNDPAATADRNDCSVVAVAAATGLSYSEVQARYFSLGRKRNKGVYTEVTMAVLRSFGYKCLLVEPLHFICRYPAPHFKLKSVTTHHPDRFRAVWADANTYLFRTSGHILCVRAGTNCDWTRGRAKRVRQIWKVVKETTS